MAHRIYIYNIDSKTKASYTHYLGEWNYEIPELMLPLFCINLKAKGTQLYSDREQGIVQLRKFYDLLTHSYTLHANSAYTDAVEKMFAMLESLPYDSFQIDGTDVFNMNEERHSQQAKDWVLEMMNKAELHAQAIASQSLAPLQGLLRYSGISFLELLQTDWVNHGLGYWNEDSYKFSYAESYEERNLQGLRNAKGHIILPAQYQQIFAFNEGVAVVEKEGKYGYINTLGQTLVPCSYSDAYDVFDIYYGPSLEDAYAFTLQVGIVEQQKKKGLLAITENQTLIPPIYDELEYVLGNLFNARIAGKYRLIDQHNKQIINVESDTEFETEGIDLFFNSTKGTAKRNYYNADGIAIGAYLEGVIESFGDNYFYVRPNKLQIKKSIIKPNGQFLDAEIDEIISLSDYKTFAYRKEKNWFIYNKRTHSILDTTPIQNVSIKGLSNHFNDVYFLQCSEGNGIYDANHGRWLLPPNLAYLQMAHLEQHYLKITVAEGMHYWDGKTEILSPLYTYISEAILRSEHAFMRYDQHKLQALNLEGEVVDLGDAAMGKLYQERNKLSGKDLQAFQRFYSSWQEKIGPDYLKFFDDHSLYQRAMDLLRANCVAEAKAALSIGAERNHAGMLAELGMIYTNTAYEAHANIPLGLACYERAAALDHKIAWNDIGYHYQNGIGYTQDTEKAEAAYLKAAELGNGLAYSNLGDLYYYGELREEDMDKALAYYLKAEKLYHFHSEKIAYIYFANADHKRLLPLLKKDDEEEFAPAYYAVMYEEGLGGLKVNLKKAIAYYEKALQKTCYAHGVQRLLFYHRAESEFANSEKFEEWLNLATANAIELNYELLGIPNPKQQAKGGFFKNLFKTKK